MGDLFFNNPIILAVIGVILLFVIVVVFLLIKKKSKKNVVVNEVKEFNSVPELDQISTEVKPFSEQDFNRQLMSQTQGIVVNENSVNGPVSDLVSNSNQGVVQNEAQSVNNSSGMPNLVPEFNQGNVQSEAQGVQSQIQGAPQFIAQPDIFGQPPIVSTGVNSAQSVDIVEPVQESEVVDIVDAGDTQNSAQSQINNNDFNSVFGQSLDNKGSDDSIDIIE